MYNNGVYLKNNSNWGASDAPVKSKWIHRIIQKNQLSFQSVAEVGTGSGAILTELSHLLPGVKEWTGYDISAQAIEIAKKAETNNLSFYHEDFIQLSTFSDCLLIIDVIEHVENYYEFLLKLRKRAAYYIFHIPLDLSCRTLLKPHILKQQRSSVGHIHYFSRDMVLWMLEDTGYTIADWFYTKPLLDIEPQQSVKNKIKKVLRNGAFAISKHRSADVLGGYSMMILAE